MPIRADRLLLSAFALLAALLVEAPTWASGEVVATGAELIVNTTTTSDQGFPDVATNGAGTFVAAWESFGQDGDLFGIFGQRLDARGEPVGSEFPVNTTTADNQFDPAVGVRADGSFVVAWASFGQDDTDDNFGIYAQRFDAAGATVGGEFLVNTHVTLDQNYPDIAIGADGGFLVAWESSGQDGSFSGVYAQRYDSDGVATGDEIRVNTTTQEEQDEVAMMATADGYVVAWESGGNDSSGDAVMMQLLDLEGNLLGSEIQVNTSFTGDQEDPDLARLADGTFAVVWESDGQDGDGETVVAQVFASDGTPLGGEIVLNATVAGDQEDPRIAPIGSDAFLVVFTGDSASTGTEIYGRLLDASTRAASGDEFQVNTSTTDDQDRVAIAGDPVLGLTISTWRAFGGHDGDAAGVLGQVHERTLFADGFESGTTDGWSLVQQ